MHKSLVFQIAGLGVFQNKKGGLQILDDFQGFQNYLICLFYVSVSGGFGDRVFGTWGTRPNKIKMIRLVGLKIPVQDVRGNVGIFQIQGNHLPAQSSGNPPHRPRATE